MLSSAAQCAPNRPIVAVDKLAPCRRRTRSLPPPHHHGLALRHLMLAFNRQWGNIAPPASFLEAAGADPNDGHRMRRNGPQCTQTASTLFLGCLVGSCHRRCGPPIQSVYMGEHGSRLPAESHTAHSHRRSIRRPSICLQEWRILNDRRSTFDQVPPLRITTRPPPSREPTSESSIKAKSSRPTSRSGGDGMMG